MSFLFSVTKFYWCHFDMLEDVALACLHMIRVKYVGDVVRTWCVFVLGKTYIPNFPFK